MISPPAYRCFQHFKLKTKVIQINTSSYLHISILVISEKTNSSHLTEDLHLLLKPQQQAVKIEHKCHFEEKIKFQRLSLG